MQMALQHARMDWENGRIGHNEIFARAERYLRWFLDEEASGQDETP